MTYKKGLPNEKNYTSANIEPVHFAVTYTTSI